MNVFSRNASAAGAGVLRITMPAEPKMLRSALSGSPSSTPATRSCCTCSRSRPCSARMPSTTSRALARVATCSSAASRSLIASRYSTSRTARVASALTCLTCASTTVRAASTSSMHQAVSAVPCSMLTLMRSHATSSCACMARALALEALGSVVRSERPTSTLPRRGTTSAGTRALNL